MAVAPAAVDDGVHLPVPWCDTCDSYRAPSALDDDGNCRSCGDPVSEAKTPAPPPRKGSIPWHFWLIIIFAAVYLGWRAVQGIMWVIGHL